MPACEKRGRAGVCVGRYKDVSCVRVCVCF